MTDDITAGFMSDSDGADAAFNIEYQCWLDRYCSSWYDAYELDDEINEQMDMLADAIMLKFPLN